VLEQRGVLSPEEIHRLANKTRRAVGATEGKAACHSDFVDGGEAQRLQGLVTLRRKEAEGSETRTLPSR
jgi:phosphomethylpyrimidine synthase